MPSTEIASAEGLGWINVADELRPLEESPAYELFAIQGIVGPSQHVLIKGVNLSDRHQKRVPCQFEEERLTGDSRGEKKKRIVV